MNELIEVFNNQNITISKGNVNSPIPHFTIEEMNLLLSKLQGNKQGLFFQFLWRTGVRVSEAISIKKSDIDFVNDEITIRWLKSRKAEHRVIPMHKSIKQILIFYCAGLKADDRLFNFTRQRADTIAKKFGFEHCHKIRHSYAINFLRQSKSPMALQELKELLGHQNITTTMEYLKVVPMQLKKSIEDIRFD